MTKINRAFNFSPGPSMLPAPVIKRLQNELLDWNGSGMSVMEISHRSNEFSHVINKSKQLLRELLNIPNNYHILFSHGGASMQFSALPLNLSSPQKIANYIITGQWGLKAEKEARRFSQTKIIANTMNEYRIPTQEELLIDSDASYVHYTPNETILGLEFPYIPDTGNTPLIADVSSNILSKPMEVEKFDVLYACAQKNIGIAGLAVIIVREDLLNQHQAHTPSLLEWQHLSDTNSLSNTMPTFAWYVLLCSLEWLKELGGVSVIEKKNRKNAELLYQCIDQSDFYHSTVSNTAHRSQMNIPFTLKNSELDALFLEQAKQANLTNLKGHASVGGMRASMYNSMPLEGVMTLIEFMQNFVQKYGK